MDTARATPRPSMTPCKLVQVIAFGAGLILATPLSVRSEGASSKLNLSLEQTHTVKELVKDAVMEAADVPSGLSVGNLLPSDLSPVLMPIAIVQKVPHIKSYQLVVGKKLILIVDPKDNKIAEAIER